MLYGTCRSTAVSDEHDSSGKFRVPRGIVTGEFGNFHKILSFFETFTAAVRAILATLKCLLILSIKIDSGERYRGLFLRRRRHVSIVNYR